MSDRELQEIYGQVPLFLQLSEAELAEIEAISRQVTVDADVELFQENDLSDAMYVVVEGLIQIRMRLHRGDEITLATLDRGEMFGELSLVDRFPRSASACTLEPTRLYCIDAAGMDRLREALRPAAFKVLRELGPVLCARLRSANAQLEDFMTAPHSAGVALQADEHGLHLGGPGPDAIRAPLADYLSDLTLFRAFDAQELKRFASICRAHLLADGEVLCEKDDPNTNLYIIVQGGLDVCAEMPDGQLSRLQRLGPDNVVGQVSWIDGHPRSATLVAWRRSLVFEADRERYNQQFDAGSPFAYKVLDLILSELALRLREADRQIFDFFKRADATTAKP